MATKQVGARKAAAQEQSGERVTILFACTQNAGRSQIAAAIASSLAGPGVRVLSEGTNPASEVHPNVVAALHELGLEPDSKPKRLEPGDVEGSDWVITMGCGETCPVFPGVHYEDWDISDPSGRPLSEVREIRDVIASKVEKLLERANAGARASEK